MPAKITVRHPDGSLFYEETINDSAKSVEDGQRAAVKAKLEKQGRTAWRWLHAESLVGALTEDRIDSEFIPMIPRYGCQCKREFDEIRNAIPFDAGNQFEVTFRWHEAVNAKLGKPQISLEEAYAIYSS